jgi:tetratricopeptide (TPR) repeat protein
MADSQPMPGPAGPEKGTSMYPRLRLALVFVVGFIGPELAFAVGGRQAPATSPSQVASSPKPVAVAAPVSTETLVSPPPSPLAEAITSYRKGDFDAALERYQQILRDQPKSPDAYAGLIRTYLKKKDVQQASDAATSALQAADSPQVHVALGEVYFRQGKNPEAEQEWVKVINSGHAEARAYMGLARVRWALSLYKKGWDMIDKAHTMDPSDPEIRKLWTARLNRTERIKFLEDYLAGENNEDAETRSRMHQYLEYLKARAKDPRGSCHLVSKTTTTETPLVRLLLDPRHLRGYGLSVEVNGRKSKLLLDTGASGILINRNLAEKSGVTRLSDMAVWGIGDKGDKGGYTAVADSLKIGELEFQNCTVRVIDQRSVVDEDGLIGADVFASFLVDIDFPNEKLHLTELPKRPEETVSTIHLRTDDEDSDTENRTSEKPTGDKPTEDHNASTAPPKETKPARGPQDRYIAPEMKGYTQIFRFGHMLLVPTSIGDVPGKLFLLDSGASTNLITPAAAREVTKVHGDPRTIVKGLSGSVKDVYTADKAILRFGYLKQENQGLIAFDLSHISDSTGTEVSGTLGFTLLRVLDIKIDYRDGLVDFSYDPKRWGR